jgi:hypothetical protein
VGVVMLDGLLEVCTIVDTIVEVAELAAAEVVTAGVVEAAELITVLVALADRVAVCRALVGGAETLLLLLPLPGDGPPGLLIPNCEEY